MGKIPCLGVLPPSTGRLAPCVLSYSSLIMSYVIIKLYNELYFILSQTQSHKDSFLALCNLWSGVIEWSLGVGPWSHLEWSLGVVLE